MSLLHVFCKRCWGPGEPTALLISKEITRWSIWGNTEHNNGSSALNKVLCVAAVKAEITRLLILPFCSTLGFDLWTTSIESFIQHLVGMMSTLKCYNHQSKQSQMAFITFFLYSVTGYRITEVWVLVFFFTTQVGPIKRSFNLDSFMPKLFT